MLRNADNLGISHTIDLKSFINFEVFSKCQYSESRTIRLFHLTWGRQWTVNLVSSGSARRVIQTDLEETKYFSEEIKISDNSTLLKIKKTIVRMFQGSINVQKTTDNITIRAMICFDFLKKKKTCFKRISFSESRTVQRFCSIQSSNDINRYSPRYLRVSASTLRQFQTKRIEEKIPKICFPVTRHCDLDRAAGELWT